MTTPKKGAGVDRIGIALLVVELVALAVLLGGLWWVFPPAALIFGGVAGIYGVERAQANRTRARAQVRRIERVA
jgi:hypothetical protein